MHRLRFLSAMARGCVLVLLRGWRRQDDERLTIDL
jgi:hypothetical protein